MGRKLDEDGDGYLTRDDFVEGILRNKFLSSKLELNAVADKFDHGDGMIDWREFIAALRPDWEERGPLTDTQRIDDEINRQVAQCTCRQKFKVFQVGEGKYRFGDSQKLRLVRILRSTVMVRVGGGWVALDEFLVKNDPCRAKGRTNLELREQFILASGVSQTMASFRSKPPRDATASGTPTNRRATVDASSTNGRLLTPTPRGMNGSRGSMSLGRGSDAGTPSTPVRSATQTPSVGGPTSRTTKIPRPARTANSSRGPSRTASMNSLGSDSDFSVASSEMSVTSSIPGTPFRQPSAVGASTPKSTTKSTKSSKLPTLKTSAS